VRSILSTPSMSNLKRNEREEGEEVPPRSGASRSSFFCVVRGEEKEEMQRKAENKQKTTEQSPREFRARCELLNQTSYEQGRERATRKACTLTRTQRLYCVVSVKE
jgi:hypothetical protein